VSSLSHRFQTGSGARLTFIEMGRGGYFSEGKAAVKPITHLSSAEVKNAWSDICISPYVFMAWCLVKHRGSFTLTLYSNTSSSTLAQKVCPHNYS